MGLPEVEFQYPITTEREEKLHQRAIKLITEEPFQLNYHWSLIKPDKHREFVTYLRSETEATITKMLHSIMHGWLSFSDCAEFPLQEDPHKDPVIELCIQAGMPLNNDALDYAFKFKLEMMTHFNTEMRKEEIEKGIRTIFERNIHMIYVK